MNRIILGTSMVPIHCHCLRNHCSDGQSDDADTCKPQQQAPATMAPSSVSRVIATIIRSWASCTYCRFVFVL